MKISEDVLTILSRCTPTEFQVKLPPGQLDRKLYMKVNSILEELGGKWNRKAQAHLFDEDPRERLEATLVAGEITRKADFGFFETPPALAKRLVEMAEVKRGALVLEPSAGRGAIVGALNPLGAEVHCVELLDENVAHLEKRFYGIHRVVIHKGDFLIIEPKQLAGECYDAIPMNPPFTKQADIDHVLHAHKFLRPGGRLVSVMSAGVLFRDNRKTDDFRQYVYEHGGEIEKLPLDSFKTSGTSVSTVVLRIGK